MSTHSAKISVGNIEDTAEKIFIRRTETHNVVVWLLILFAGSLLLSLLFIIFTLAFYGDTFDGGVFTTGLVFVGLGLGLPFWVLVNIQMEIDPISRKFLIRRTYLVGYPRTKTIEIFFDQIEDVYHTYQTSRSGKKHTNKLSIDLIDQEPILLEFMNDFDKASLLEAQFAAWLGLELEEKEEEPDDNEREEAVESEHLTPEFEALFEMSTEEYRSTLWRDLRSWGIVMLIMGAFRVLLMQPMPLANGLIFIAVGAATFYFRSTFSFFAIYLVLLLWSNVNEFILSPTTSLSSYVFSIIMIMFLISRLNHFRRAERELLQDDNENTMQHLSHDAQLASWLFPWLSFIFALTSGGLLIGVLFVAVALYDFVLVTSWLEWTLDFSLGLALGLSALSVGIGVGSFASRAPSRWASGLGVFGGLLVYTLWAVVTLSGG